jgi:predicted PurR-regulated permease PerM
VRFGKERGLPNPLGAAIVVVLFLGALGAGIYHLAGPATEWIETAPQKLKIAEYKFRGVTESLDKMRDAAQNVEEATGSGSEESVEVDDTSVEGMVVNQAFTLGSGLLITVFLLYFLLASGDMLLRKIVNTLPRFRHRRNAVRIIRSIEQDLSHYIGMVCLINLGLGTAVAGAMYVIGMPNPLLWGTLAGLLNFIPYLGPVLNLTVVSLVALVSFDQATYALLAPVLYLLINGIESSLVTPTVMGWRLRLNPVVIFISITFWTWIWGIPGALLAVPLLAGIKIVCDRIQLLHPVGVLLGQ